MYSNEDVQIFADGMRRVHAANAALALPLFSLSVADNNATLPPRLLITQRLDRPNFVQISDAKDFKPFQTGSLSSWQDQQ